MTRRQILAASLTVWGLTATMGAAEVIDLGAGESDLRVRSGVLDFGNGIPAREMPRVGERWDSDKLAVDSEAEIVLASYGINTIGRGLKDSARIEELIVDVGDDYLRHPGLKEAGLSGTEWLALFRANIAVESGFNPEALSPVGAIGLGQLMPDTAAALGVDPHDPEANLRGSARYLLSQLETFGAADLALAAYNAGPESVREYGGIPPFAETLDHVAKVLRLASSTLIPE